MYVALTPESAKDLGRTLRFIRHGRNMTISDLSKRSGVSAGYLQNIETGVRLHTGEESFIRVGRALGVPDTAILDLVLRARIATALERRGLTGEQRVAVMRGTEALLASAGVPLTDSVRLVAEMMS